MLWPDLDSTEPVERAEDWGQYTRPLPVRRCVSYAPYGALAVRAMPYPGPAGARVDAAPRFIAKREPPLGTAGLFVPGRDSLRSLRWPMIGGRTAEVSRTQRQRRNFAIFRSERWKVVFGKGRWPRNIVPARLCRNQVSTESPTL